MYTHCVYNVYTDGLATKTTTINVRTSPATKKEAARVFEKLGLDLSSGVNLYLARVAREQAVPFQLFAGNPAGRCPTCGHLKFENVREGRGETREARGIREAGGGREAKRK